MNVMEAFEKDAAASLRSKIIEAILATDMSHHFELVEKFSARVSACQSHPLLADFKDALERDKAVASRPDRRMLLQGFTHMSDLGHCCRPWDVHKLSSWPSRRSSSSRAIRSAIWGCPSC